MQLDAEKNGWKKGPANCKVVADVTQSRAVAAAAAMAAHTGEATSPVERTTDRWSLEEEAAAEGVQKDDHGMPVTMAWHTITVGK